MDETERLPSHITALSFSSLVCMEEGRKTRSSFLPFAQDGRA